MGKMYLIIVVLICLLCFVLGAKFSKRIIQFWVSRKKMQQDYKKISGEYFWVNNKITKALNKIEALEKEQLVINCHVKSMKEQMSNFIEINKTYTEKKQYIVPSETEFWEVAQMYCELHGYKIESLEGFVYFCNSKDIDIGGERNFVIATVLKIIFNNMYQINETRQS